MMPTIRITTDSIKKVLSQIVLPSDLLEGEMIGMDYSEGNPKKTSQPCVFFRYDGFDFDILVDEKIVMADEKVYSFKFKTLEEMLSIVKQFSRFEKKARGVFE